MCRVGEFLLGGVLRYPDTLFWIVNYADFAISDDETADSHDFGGCFVQALLACVYLVKAGSRQSCESGLQMNKVCRWE